MVTIRYLQSKDSQVKEIYCMPEDFMDVLFMLDTKLYEYKVSTSTGLTKPSHWGSLNNNDFPKWVQKFHYEE